MFFLTFKRLFFQPDVHLTTSSVNDLSFSNLVLELSVPHWHTLYIIIHKYSVHRYHCVDLDLTTLFLCALCTDRQVFLSRFCPDRPAYNFVQCIYYLYHCHNDNRHHIPDN